MATERTQQQLARDAANGAFSDSVSKAVCVFLDSLIAAGSDAGEKTACRERLVTALTAHRDGYNTTLDVINQIFPQ
jgi:hypothetical protein